MSGAGDRETKVSCVVQVWGCVSFKICVAGVQCEIFHHAVACDVTGRSEKLDSDDIHWSALYLFFMHKLKRLFEEKLCCMLRS